MTYPIQKSDHLPGEKYYGFYGRLRKEFPSQIVADVTEICNLACIHCPHPTFKQSEHYEGAHLSPELNTKMVDEVREHGRGITRYIRYSGSGEPLVHPYIFEMLDYAVKMSDVTVTLTTNGTIMRESQAERLLETGVHLIDISLDAHRDETYAAIRANGSLKTTRQNVLNLLRLRKQFKGPTKIVVSFVEQEKNQHEAAPFEQYWKDQGADYVVVRRMHSASGTLESATQLIRQIAPVQARRPCLYPWERILVNPKGQLLFCPSDWVHGSVICNYRDHTIRETWNGPFYLRLREAHLRNEYKDHGFCNQCPDWKLTRWPNEGRSYADMVEELSSLP